MTKDAVFGNDGADVLSHVHRRDGLSGWLIRLQRGGLTQKDLGQQDLAQQNEQQDARFRNTLGGESGLLVLHDCMLANNQT
mgnify:CR=1 FL=1